MEWKSLATPAAFCIGIILGAGLTRNKYVWYILISYIIITVLISLFAGQATKIKDSVDKKMALKEAGIETANKGLDYMAHGHTIGEDAFDKIYPMISFFIGVGFFIALVILLFRKEFIYALITFFSMGAYILLHQIWRKTRRLENVDIRKN